MSTVALTLRLAIYILTGYAVVRFGVVSKDFHRQLSSLMLTVPLPLLILRSFYITDFSSEALSQFGSMLLATVVTLTVLLIVGLLARNISSNPAERKVCVYAMLTSNFTFFGMPLVESLFGSEGLFYYTIFTTFARVVYYGCPPYMLGDRGDKLDIREFFKQMFCPTIMAVIVGFIMYFAQIKPPAVIDSVIQGFAATGTPFGMMLCGMTLANTSLREAFTRPAVFIMSGLRLLICPGLVMIACLLCGFKPLIVKLAVVYSAMPFGALLPTFATKYCSDEHSAIYGSTLVSLSTILCVVTVPMWIYIFNTFI